MEEPFEEFEWRWCEMCEKFTWRMWGFGDIHVTFMLHGSDVNVAPLSRTSEVCV